MDLQKIAESQMKAVFKMAASMVKNALYKELISFDDDEEYNAEPVYKKTPIQCIVANYSKQDINIAYGDIQVSDKKVLIPLSQLNREIRTKNFLIIDNVEYRIQNVETDPTETSCTVQARQ